MIIHSQDFQTKVVQSKGWTSILLSILPERERERFCLFDSIKQVRKWKHVLINKGSFNGYKIIMNIMTGEKLSWIYVANKESFIGQLVYPIGWKEIGGGHYFSQL